MNRGIAVEMQDMGRTLAVYTGPISNRDGFS
jgi:hypothetical protein